MKEKMLKYIRWLLPTLLILAMFAPGTYWKFYWFNYRIMERINSVITSLT